MKIKEIPSVGISGISVEFNHSELIVLKGLQQRITEASKESQHNDGALNHSSIAAIQDVSILLTKMIPQDVMSLDDAEQELFKQPESQHQEM